MATAIILLKAHNLSVTCNAVINDSAPRWQYYTHPLPHDSRNYHTFDGWKHVLWRVSENPEITQTAGTLGCKRSRTMRFAAGLEMDLPIRALELRTLFRLSLGIQSQLLEAA